MINVLNVDFLCCHVMAQHCLEFQIELFDVIIVMCETIDNKTNDRRFDMQTRHATDRQNCSINKRLQT